MSIPLHTGILLRVTNEAKQVWWGSGARNYIDTFTNNLGFPEKDQNRLWLEDIKIEFYHARMVRYHIFTTLTVLGDKPIPKDLWPLVLSFFGREFKKPLAEAVSAKDFLTWIENNTNDYLDADYRFPKNPHPQQ